MIARLVVVLSLLVPFVIDSKVAAAASDGRRTAIVLPVELNGFFLEREQVKREVTLALEERLRAGQIDVVRGALTPAEGECREFACLSRIADAHNAALVVAGRVVSNQRVKVSYHLRVRIVERSAGKVDMREREANCDNCTESQARDQLATLMTSVIANEPEPKPLPPREKTAPPQALLSQSPSGAQTRERFTSPQRWILRLSGIAALAVGVGFLVQGIVEVAQDGKVIVENEQAFRLETATTGQPLFFTLGGVSSVAGVVLSVLGWKSWPARVAVVPGLAGGQLVVGGAF
jgi:hypothetical protein